MHCWTATDARPGLPRVVRAAINVATPPKWQKNDLVSEGHRPAWPRWELAWTMNWVDRLRTSADKRMWSGRRAVVMRTGRRAELLGVELGCPRTPRSSARAVAAAPSFQTCFACVHMYILYACVYICVCVYVCGHDIWHDICIYMHVCMYLYIYAFIHVWMCMCMHICA